MLGSSWPTRGEQGGLGAGQPAREGDVAHRCWLGEYGGDGLGAAVQSKDRAPGLPLWQVDVIDGDPQARDKTVRVKVAAPDQPVLPAPAAGLPFVPVEFAGLTVTPYVNQAGRLAYSLKATGVRAVRAGRGSGGAETAG